MLRDDEYYMRRALQLAANGLGHVSPNPAVGCVIVGKNGKIIGEGWHRCYGEGHAEVNAVNSVADRNQLCDATVYVTLEPCSHYGKTPPCAELLAGLPIKRVVAALSDPNPKVAGRGLEMLRKAGKEVEVGVLQQECRDINRTFLTAQESSLPFITLKWACNADGMMGNSADTRIIISNPQTEVWMHRERTLHDGIMIGRQTCITDNPSLTARRWPGNQPVPIITGGNGSPVPGSTLSMNPKAIWLPRMVNLREALGQLRNEHHITSLLVEGGHTLLHSFIEANLFDRIRRETNPLLHGGDIKAPRLPDGLTPERRIKIEGNIIESWVKKSV